MTQTEAPYAPEAEVLDGATVLDELHDNAITRFVVMPSAEAADAATLWIAATHAQLSWEHASRLHPWSPLKRCGKTRLLEVAAEVVHRPLKTANISVAALVRSIDEGDPPTLLLDEADAVFAKRRGEISEQAETIRGILNAGYSCGWPYTRWDAAHRQLEQCPTYAMAALASIGALPDTIEDRSVNIPMRRRAPGERIAPWRTRRVLPALHAIRDRLAAWVVPLRETLKEADPELPVEDREFDVWAPLIAIADAAGGAWPERARRACLALTGTARDAADEGTVSERLLDDLHTVFGDAEMLATATILAALNAIEEAPWGEWNGKSLTARALARLLRPYGIRPVKWPGGLRGYRRADFEDAWARYRQPPEQNAQTAQPDSESYWADAWADAPNKAPNTASDSTWADGRMESGIRLGGATAGNGASVGELPSEDTEAF